jgi:hypothetical protein
MICLASAAKSVQALMACGGVAAGVVGRAWSGGASGVGTASGLSAGAGGSSPGGGLESEMGPVLGKQTLSRPGSGYSVAEPGGQG